MHKNANYFKTFLTSIAAPTVALTHIAVSQLVFLVRAALFYFFRILPYYEHLPVFLAKQRSTGAVLDARFFVKLLFRKEEETSGGVKRHPVLAIWK